MSYEITKRLDNLYEAFTGTTEGLEGGTKTNIVDISGYPQGKPDYIDITSGSIASGSVIYEGYVSGSTYFICKIDYSTDIITRTWRVGSWTDRVPAFSASTTLTASVTPNETPSVTPSITPTASEPPIAPHPQPL